MVYMVQTSKGDESDNVLFAIKAGAQASYEFLSFLMKLVNEDINFSHINNERILFPDNSFQTICRLTRIIGFRN